MNVLGERCDGTSLGKKHAFIKLHIHILWMGAPFSVLSNLDRSSPDILVRSQGFNVLFLYAIALEPHRFITRIAFEKMKRYVAA